MQRLKGIAAGWMAPKAGEASRKGWASALESGLAYARRFPAVWVHDLAPALDQNGESRGASAGRSGLFLLPLLLLLLLAACGKAPEPKQVLLRDPAVPVRSIAGFDFSRMTGEWVQAAALAASGTACRPGRLSAHPEGPGLRLQGELCLGGRMERINSRATPSGPGRMQLSGQMADWWVIWADWDMRTLVLADPKGSFGVVLDRGRISSDRMKAARDLLDFNGYAVSALR